MELNTFFDLFRARIRRFNVTVTMVLAGGDLNRQEFFGLSSAECNELQDFLIKHNIPVSSFVVTPLH